MVLVVLMVVLLVTTGASGMEGAEELIVALDSAFEGMVYVLLSNVIPESLLAILGWVFLCAVIAWKASGVMGWTTGPYSFARMNPATTAFVPLATRSRTSALHRTMTRAPTLRHKWTGAG